MLKGPLKERRRGVRPNDPLRFRQRLRHMLMVVRNQMPAGMALTGELTHLMPRVKDELQRLAVGSGQVAGVEVVPQAQVALLAG